MNKPGGHRTGLDAHFGVDTSMFRNTSRNWPGIGGADAAPEPLALRVDNADRGRLLRYVQPNIMRHRNLRGCKSPGNMPGSRHYRCLRLRTAITRGPHHQGGCTRHSHSSFHGLNGVSGKWDATSLSLERYTGYWSGLGRLR